MKYLMLADSNSFSNCRSMTPISRPKKGSALLFFPAAGGIPNVPFDIRTLHCGEVVAEDASQDKWIAQLWLRKGTYTATAPKENNHEEASDAIADYCTAT